MVVCLRQLLNNAEYIVMFRCVYCSPTASNSHAYRSYYSGTRAIDRRVEGRFAGRIDWNIGMRTCSWSVQVPGGGRPRFNKDIATFGGERGTDGTNQRCLDSFGTFLDQVIPSTARTTRRDQFADVQAFHDQLWEKCIAKFGEPTLTTLRNVG